MEPIQSSSIPQAIVHRIIQLIGEGTWKPGDRLPAQRQLARELNVGMSSLREALQTLQGMGVLCLYHGQGTFVCERPGQIVERYLNLALALNGNNMEDFLDARRAIEGGLAYLAARRATEEQIARLIDLAEGMMAAVDAGDDAKFDELDLAYHRLIAEMSNSNLLQYLGGTLFETLDKFIRVVPHTPHGCQRHAEVAAAIESRDPDRSEKAMHDLVDVTAAYVQLSKSGRDRSTAKKA